MAVGYLEPCDHERDTLTRKGSALSLRDAPCRGEHRIGRGGVEVHPVVHLGARDDEQVSSSDGIDGHERGAVLVLVDEGPRELAGDDPAEDGRHVPRIRGFATVGAVQRRLATLPNAVTLIRLCCLPVVPWLLLAEDRRTAAAVALGALGSTDWVDGWLARRLGQVSEFGAAFDPVVDRLLFLVGAASVLVDGAVPAWFLVAVGLRELLVGAMMTGGTALGMPRIPVLRSGKRYTFLLMIAIPLLLLGADGGRWAWLATSVGWSLGVVGLAMGWIVGVRYVPIVRAEVRKARALRTVR